MEEGDIEETQSSQEPLFKLLSDASTQDSAKAPNPKFEDGRVLPKKLRSRFLQEAQPCVPLEEIDPYFRNKQTFVVIGRWGTIHRFSSSPDGQLTLGPNNAVRRLSIYLLTNWIFSTLIIATLLLNVFALIKTQNYEISNHLDGNAKKTWVIDSMYIINYVCLAVYCFELVLKVIAKGFIGDAFTSFRDPWTYLDMLVIWTGFYYFHSFILFRKSTYWLRIFKIIPLVPSIRHACKLSVKAVMRLRGMMILGILLWWVFALVGTQIYMGSLSQKCIKNFPEGSKFNDSTWAQHNWNESNWYHENGGIVLCGNASGTKECPADYTCLQGFGRSPDYGTTSFDSVLWSFLSVIRVATEDFTEEIFKQVLETNGPWNILYFLAIFFLMTIPMGSLFFAILANFFTESKAPTELELEEITALADVHEFDAGQNSESLVITSKTMGSTDELVGFRKAMHSFIFYDWTRNVIVLVTIIDVIGICLLHYGIVENYANHLLVMRILPYLAFLVYTTEFVLKMIALGPAKYYKNKFNVIDFFVLLTFFLEVQAYFGSYTDRYLMAPFRLLKLIQYWPSLRMILGIYYKTIKALSGWILYTMIILGFLVFIGPFEIGRHEVERYRPDRPQADQSYLPRFSFIDFWQSFRSVVRMLVAEWIETFWDCYQSAGSNCILYYLAVNACGALLISFLLVGVVYSTIQELKNNYDPKKERGLRLLLRKTYSLICSPIKRIQPKDMKNGAEATDGAEAGGEEVLKGKPEGKEGRRKKSIVAESTGQLRKVMQDTTESWAYKIGCCAVIIIASLAMIFEDTKASEDLRTCLFVIEILFTVLFVVIVIYELLSFGVKESLTNRGWLFDTLIVVEMIANLTIIGFSVTRPRFLVGLFYIRSFRPLMLISRIDWLKAPFKGLKFEVKMIWETVLAIFFIWLFFATFGMHWLSGKYYKCIDPNVDEEVFPTLDKVHCLAGNYSWSNNPFNFDSAGTGFLNMVFLSSRMGWISVVQDASDATGVDEPRQRENTKMWFIYFIVFMLAGAFGALGIIFSYIYNKFQEDKGYNIILTEKQVDSYNEQKSSKEPKQTWISLEEEYIPPPESACLLCIYNFVTNVKFDAVIMALIIFDNVWMSLDHYNVNSMFSNCLMYVSYLITLLYVVEMIVKLIAWGKHYFRNAWNWLDMIIALTGIFEAMSGLIFGRHFGTGIIRILRLLRIFRFLLAKKCGSNTAKIFLSAISNIRPVYVNLILLQLTVMWAFALLGNYLFASIPMVNGIDDVFNFRSFRYSFWTLILLLGFPCLDGIYLSLSNQEDCELPDENNVRGTCGNPGAALIYLGLYVSITFMVLMNLYAALISEIMFEINRFGNISKDREGSMALEDVATENGKSGEAGETGELIEESGNTEEAE